MNAHQQLAIVEKCKTEMKRAGICFAIVARFGPGNGGAFLTGSPRRAKLRDENNQTLADNMRYYAGEFLDKDCNGGIYEKSSK